MHTHFAYYSDKGDVNYKGDPSVYGKAFREIDPDSSLSDADLGCVIFSKIAELSAERIQPPAQVDLLAEFLTEAKSGFVSVDKINVIYRLIGSHLFTLAGGIFCILFLGFVNLLV